MLCFCCGGGRLVHTLIMVPHIPDLPARLLFMSMVVHHERCRKNPEKGASDEEVHDLSGWY